MGYTSEIVLGGKVLNITSCIPFKQQRKYKQIMGKSLAQVDIIGLDAQQTELSMSGIVFGTTLANLDTNRAAVQALDVASAFVLVDGLHNGTYYVEPGSLKFSDVANDSAGMVYVYTIKLIEE